MDKSSNKKKFVFTLIILITVFICIVVITSLFYSNSILNLIYSSNSQSTDNFVNHDVELVKQDLKNKKERLLVELIHSDINSENKEYYQEIINNTFDDSFYEIALIDKNDNFINRKFSDKSENNINLISLKREEIIKAIESNNEITLLNYPQNDYCDDAGLFILKLDPSISKNYKAVVSICCFKTLYEKIDIKSLDNSSRVFIFLENGDYLLPGNKKFANIDNKNFFKQINLVNLKNISFDELTEIITNKQDVNFIYKADNRISHVSVQYIKNTNAFYCLTTPEVVLREQNQKVIKFTTFLIITLFIVLSIFIFVFIYVFYNLSNVKRESETKQEFLSTMSHEIRTPLNGIIGLVHLMQTNINNKDKLSYYLQKTTKTSDYLLQLINNILDISKFDNGKIKLANNPFDLDDMLDSVVSINRDAMTSKNINFEVNRNIFCSTIFGDEIRIQQIIMNLIGNALKFTEENGKITLTVTQENTFEADEISTIFKINDNGCGISKEFQKHIFEAFSQERNKLKASQKGTGLGLAISQKLSQQMNGSISVESELGIGSTFTFTLPSKIATPKQVTDYVLSSTPVDTEKDHKILIAEDNDLSADILDEVFSEVKFKHKVVRDGKQVIEEFSESDIDEYDVILMDIQMPYYDGYEATQIIRKLNRSDAKTVKIIACSANTFEEDKENAIKAGMNGFIVKPVNINSLLEILGK